MGDINDKDERIKAHKHWIVEWAELETQFGRRQISHIKSFMTSTVDDIRKPYGYSSQEMYRHYVLCGTTNQQEFLPDPTGNRRFWVVPINQIINIKYVIDNRDKLWGAVKAAFESGENWWFDKNEEIKARVMMKQCKNYCIILSNILEGTAFLCRGALKIVAHFRNGMSEIGVVICEEMF